MKINFKKILKILISSIIGIGLTLCLMILFINIYMINTTKKYILTEEEAVDYKFECIIVLGASVRPNGTPSKMLQDRLDKSISLYFDKISNKILMSGDHIYEDYDEVTVMKKYATEKGVPSSDVFMDHSGIKTYDSMYRLKHVYEVNRSLIVTQEYHLYRALYIARKLGVEAYGVPADHYDYSGQEKRDIREILARVKDFFKVMFKRPSYVVGNTISVNGDGDVTNNK